MRIISRKRLREFGDRHPDAVTPLDDWYSLVRLKTYKSPADVKADFASVSFISNDVTVFNIGGNKYRLSVSIRYRTGIVYIRHVLTHEEYDRRTREGTL
ncbi:MAG TPA: type II toxin-antitoxin system HigB family toxin [Longimicrobiaceae bacterium]|nr:type II toxin-antitoxin system HigB family toxin [Longimicrobiaceae bacterium]